MAKCFKYKDQGKRLMGAEFFVIMVMDVPATGQMKYFHEGHAPFVHWLGHDLIVSSKLSSAYIKAILLCLENLCTVLMHTSHFWACAVWYYTPRTYTVNQAYIHREIALCYSPVFDSWGNPCWSRFKLCYKCLHSTHVTLHCVIVLQARCRHNFPYVLCLANETKKIV